MALGTPLPRAALLRRGPRPVVWGVLVLDADLQAAGMTKCPTAMALAAGEPRGGAVFLADAVVVSVARLPSNREWPPQIPEPPPAKKWVREGSAGAGLHNSLLGRLPSLCGPSHAERQGFSQSCGVSCPPCLSCSSSGL